MTVVGVSNENGVTRIARACQPRRERLITDGMTLRVKAGRATMLGSPQLDGLWQNGCDEEYLAKHLPSCMWPLVFTGRLLDSSRCPLAGVSNGGCPALGKPFGGPAPRCQMVGVDS
ncbi:MAG: hypothetical protein Q4G70_13825 [Pseudomonadota bacterium]|nr:hypothetical protein [Pseudomonadota bacterium]